MNEKGQAQLRFSGSVWCNLDIALRNMDQIFGRAVQPLGLTIIEWYILRALFERDGQHASELARAVGRAATSFTPNLDKLQDKHMIERKPDPSDRRAVHIYLTENAERYRAAVMQSAKQIDEYLGQMIDSDSMDSFQRVLSALQSVEPDYSMEVPSPINATATPTNGHHAGEKVKVRG